VLKYVNFVITSKILSGLNLGPAAALSVPAGWFRVGSCDVARTACAVTVIWRPYLVQVSIIIMRFVCEILQPYSCILYLNCLLLLAEYYYHFNLYILWYNFQFRDILMHFVTWEWLAGVRPSDWWSTACGLTSRNAVGQVVHTHTCVAVPSVICHQPLVSGTLWLERQPYTYT